ncbi:GSCOCG00003594001-RA-CDS [Cotesia congregata]|nr:GSCOCG00003594001-RA-CDS [Cotesia congregata]
MPSGCLNFQSLFGGTCSGREHHSSYIQSDSFTSNSLASLAQL